MEMIVICWLVGVSRPNAFYKVPVHPKWSMSTTALVMVYGVYYTGAGNFFCPSNLRRWIESTNLKVDLLILVNCDSDIWCETLVSYKHVIVPCNNINYRFHLRAITIAYPQGISKWSTHHSWQLRLKEFYRSFGKYPKRENFLNLTNSSACLHRPFRWRTHQRIGHEGTSYCWPYSPRVLQLSSSQTWRRRIRTKRRRPALQRAQIDFNASRIPSCKRKSIFSLF